ncbi:GNAT family N-acetyltransferase [Kineococcus rhizosphaerae]|uniref:Acetyltransferase (GNAT) family protein n=1 Tax=Kineococcus rhizosphaerae TaxID=559628 RepID=A0A2T0R426_9ACTN|nr:GNAT family N-acetyltransferase [Kineococcus rhizosphaerae]PRY15103.1 acetyltransferase (GNAT) family protein [Kineococcus rhizosphaerae]
MLIRRALDGDAGELLTVQRAAFVAEAQRYGDPFLPPLREDLDGVRAAIASQVVLVALEATRLVGSVRVRLDGRVGHVGRLAVAPDRQRLGIGTRLLAAVEEAAPQEVRELRLFTGADSAETVTRYGRAGYVRTGQGEDDRGVRLVHLAKVLRPPA